MKKINWRARFIAAAIHFVITLAVAGIAALLIFSVWFPHGLSAIVGGTALFFIMLGCDVVLGPMLSLVVYSSAKPRRELVQDYCLIGLLQLSALVYGVYVVSESRPIFVAFDVRRLEVITALELDSADLATGADREYRSKSLTGPRLITIQRPTNPKEKTDLMFSELGGGRGAYLFPKYYRPYDADINAIHESEFTIESLLKDSGSAEPTLRAAIDATDKPQSDLRWLYVHHRFGFGVALIDANTKLPVRFIAVNPQWLK